MRLWALHAFVSGRVIPGIEAVAFDQLAQMLGHLKERGVALLSGA